MSDETIEQIVAWCCSCSQINPKWTNVCQNCGCIKENARDLVPEGYVKQSSNMSYNQAIDDAEQAEKMNKIQITIKQAEEFNRMRECLRRIGAVKGEELEMAYENMQSDAAQNVRGVKKITMPTPVDIHKLIGEDGNL